MMRKLSAVILVALLLVTGGAMAAQEERKIYRTTDADGNPVFSDQGREGDAEVDVPPSNAFDAESLAEEYELIYRKDEKSGAKAFSQYQRLAITSPANDEAVRANAGNVQISWQVEPGIQEGHRVELLLDGQVLQTVSGAGSVGLDNVDRGTHQAQLRVIDQETGDVFQQGPTQTFHVLRHSRLF